ncbi:MAG: NADAR family protein [Saprospiraceae bacterium]|nr:NADAR family protein [Saprospiraceae bacterium]
MNPLSKANPQQVIINGKTYDYLGFYFPGNNTDWDDVYGVPYFGNFWPLSFEVGLKGSAKYRFHTAEAAYQASKWWNNNQIVQAFEAAIDGDAAFHLKNNDYKSTPFDGEYGGYSTGEEAMFEILKCKFSDDHPELKAALGASGNAYLLEHGAILKHQDMVWSDGNNGRGTNHLGLCLMEVREFYFPGQGNPLEDEDGATVVMACRNALLAEMNKRGLSADNKYPTK